MDAPAPVPGVGLVARSAARALLRGVSRRPAEAPPGATILLIPALVLLRRAAEERGVFPVELPALRQQLDRSARGRAGWSALLGLLGQTPGFDSLDGPGPHDRALGQALDLLLALPPRIEAAGEAHEGLLGFEVAARGAHFVLLPGPRRRLAGAHYTPAPLARAVVARALAPLTAGASPAQIEALGVCDPAMGTGIFLLEAARHLASALGEARRHAGEPPDEAEALARVARQAVHGVDLDPIAVRLARVALWVLAGGGGHFDTIADRLREGDALVDPAMPRDDRERAASGSAFPWREAFPAIFSGPAPGFDAVIGNPPWISYAGRAAQPLDPGRRAIFTRAYASFAGYRSLQALFVERGASLLRPGGRLGLLVPASMSELSGYAPARQAHDARCVSDGALPEISADAFDGVFQPCMALLSTRRPARDPPPPPALWPLARTDLDRPARDLLAYLSSLPPLPPAIFGERGYRTSQADRGALAVEARGAHAIPLRGGGDIQAFCRGAPSLHADPSRLAHPLRPAAEWARVRVLVRQTARYPIAAFADEAPFRNSLLACFEAESLSAGLLVAFLNASPVRWFHHATHRDARHGMPQVKVGHLRRLPAPLAQAQVRRDLDEVGRHLGARNCGLSRAEQRDLDALACLALGIDQEGADLIARWAGQPPG
jgi:hypothetical protein